MMNPYILMKASPSQQHLLDNLLQLYAHDINNHFKYTIKMDCNCNYRIKSARDYLTNGWGYLIIVSCEYAGFILLNGQATMQEGVFISEFYILPQYRNGHFARYIILSLFSTLEGVVEFRLLKSNKRALFVFEYLAKRYLSEYQKIDEYEYEEEYYRFTLDLANLNYDLSKYKMYIK